MLRAVPETVFTAAARSAAVRSLSLVLAISSTCARVTLPTLFLFGIGDPFSIPAARSNRIDAGGLLVTKVNERSAYTVTITGMTRPAMFWVCALKALQNSMILTPRWPSAGPTGGDGLAAPAGICSLIDPTTFLATLNSFPVYSSRDRRLREFDARIGESIVIVSGLLYLHKVELDRSCAAEDRNENADLALLGLDFLDGAVEVLEGTVDDLDRLAHFEQHLGLGPERTLLHLLLDFLDLGHRDFGRIGGMPDEAGDFRRILYDVPGLVVEHHLHEDIAGEKFAAGDLARTALAEFLHALDRHQHLADLFFLVERADPLLEGGLGLVLVARVGVDDIPLHRGLGGGLCNWLSHV